MPLERLCLCVCGWVCTGEEESKKKKKLQTERGRTIEKKSAMGRNTSVQHKLFVLYFESLIERCTFFSVPSSSSSSSVHYSMNEYIENGKA